MHLLSERIREKGQVQWISPMNLFEPFFNTLSFFEWSSVYHVLVIRHSHVNHISIIFPLVCLSQLILTIEQDMTLYSCLKLLSFIFLNLIILLLRLFRLLYSNKVISLSSQSDLTADQLQWPSFHNGVATGLRVYHGSSQVNTTLSSVHFNTF